MAQTGRNRRWNRLYETASAQDGHFTTAQAARAGYSPQLLAKYLKNGRIRRIRRGVYRLVHYPAGDHEDLTVLWLWSDRAGVFTHETALALHELSDALPAKVHMTLPEAWRRRRLRVPRGVAPHHADVPDDERTWVGAVPVTDARRTLVDCAAAQVAPGLVRDAFEAAAERGMLARDSVPEVAAYLKRFFPLSGRRSGPRFGPPSAAGRTPSP
jgi:predicted transcriptional regulator of viral defense system